MFEGKNAPKTIHFWITCPNMITKSIYICLSIHFGIISAQFAQLISVGQTERETIQNWIDPNLDRSGRSFDHIWASLQTFIRALILHQLPI